MNSYVSISVVRDGNTIDAVTLPIGENEDPESVVLDAVDSLRLKGLVS